MDQLWMSRHGRSDMLGGDIFKELRPSGHCEFWENLRDVGLNPLGLYVAESHVIAPESFQKSRTGFQIPEVMIVFDQHLDTFGDVDKMRAGEYKTCTCGNWLLKLLVDLRECGDHLTVLHVMPDWAIENSKKQHKKVIEEFKGWLHLLTMDQFMGYMRAGEMPRHKGDITTVNLGGFVCRSGAWTPPWADAEFLQFLDASDTDWEELKLLHFGGWVDDGTPGLTKDSFFGLYPRTWDEEAYMKIREKTDETYRKLMEMTDDD